jgi:hypothetical protein
MPLDGSSKQNGLYPPFHNQISNLPFEDLEGRSRFEIMDVGMRRIVLDMLTRTNSNQTDAAEPFKTPLSTLNQKIQRLRTDINRRCESQPFPGSSQRDTPTPVVPLLPHPGAGQFLRTRSGL